MRIFSLLFFILSANVSFAQSTDTAKIYTSDSAQIGLFEMVDIKPSIDQKVWRKLLFSYLQKFIEDAATKGMKQGVYTVNVQFIVETDGSISQIKAINDPGYALAQGSENIMRVSPRWNPAEKNGQKVRCYHVQPFTFVIQEQ